MVGGDFAEERPIAERYDPATGRFSMAEPLPPVDAAVLRSLDVPADAEQALLAGGGGGGTLVASGGDALLVGLRWYGGEHSMRRTLRYAAATGEWSEVGIPTVRWCTRATEDGTCEAYAEAGASYPEGIVVALADGRVLAAGGYSDQAPTGVTDASVLDPATGEWQSVESMPGARVGAAATLLLDGRVLVAGGYHNPSDGYPRPLGDAFLFDPGE